MIKYLLRVRRRIAYRFDTALFRLAALKSLDVAPAIPAFFPLPAEIIAASYFHKSHIVRLYVLI